VNNKDWLNRGMEIEIGPIISETATPSVWVINKSEATITLTNQDSVGQLLVKRHGNPTGSHKRMVPAKEIKNDSPQIETTSLEAGEEAPTITWSKGFAELDPGDEERNLVCDDEKLQALLSTNIPVERKSAFLQLLQYYRDVFTNSFSGVPWAVEPFDIQLEPGHRPFKSRGYRFCHAHLEALRLLLDKWTEEGVISKSSSPYASPAFFVPKPGGRGLRFVVDYRELNKITIPDRFPLPVIEDLFAQFHGDMIFSTWDCLSGFNQQSVSDTAKDLTTFITPLGCFRVHRLMMGLRNAPSIFMKSMLLMVEGLHGVKVYLDDVAISSGEMASTQEEEGLDPWDIHLSRVSTFIHRCAEYRLRLNPSKCHIGNGEIKYLGYIISAEGLKPDPEKVQAVQSMEAPADVTDVRSFLGLINYYRSFIPYCAEYSAPLSALLTKGTVFRWGEQQQIAFDKLKSSLADHCLRSHYDPNVELELYTDCSQYASGAVLSQKISTKEGSLEDRVIAFFSRTLSAAERNYSTHQQECLAIVSAIKYFHQFLAARHFQLYTDHYSLATVMRWKDPPMRIARWIQLLSEYDFTAQYKAGSTLCNADALSRLPSHYVRRNLSPADLPGKLRVSSRTELGGLTSNPRLQDMLEERMPPMPEVQARTPVGPILVSPVTTRSRSLDSSGEGHIPEETTTGAEVGEPRENIGNEDENREPSERESDDWPFARVFQYLGRMFQDSEDHRLYVITDVWWDESTQSFQGCRSPADGLPPDAEEEGSYFDFDYFLRELADKPVEVHPSHGHQALVNEEFRKAARETVHLWVDTGAIKVEDLFVLPDEFGVSHLYRRYFDEVAKQEHYQLIIPDGPSGEVIKHHLLHQCHAGGGGHLRRNKMYQELLKRCYWKGMYADTKRYAESCDSCQARGTSKDRRESTIPIMTWPEVKFPFERVSIDVLGPMGHKTESGCTHIVVAVDHFTKWVEAEAYRGAPTAEDLCQFYMRHFLHRHGVPDCIVADNGSNITANELNALLFKEMGSTIRNVTTYHPQANGQVERLNAVICDFLSHYCTVTDQRYWDRFLEATIFAINTSVNRVTGYTPFFLVHGREARRVIDKRLPDWSGFKWRRRDWREYAEHVQQEVNRCAQIAGENLHRSHSMYNQPLAVHRISSSFETASERLRRNFPMRRFKEGDEVLLYVPVTKTTAQNLQIRKLNKFWRGPFRVEKALNAVTYQLRLSDAKLQSFHVSRLKPYRQRYQYQHQPF
jgi:RNase H-like domain found in reverse transcriptase/Integrase zinc binding domain/Reverse transcriptase (RNA-dependent DNA polymerase)